jgi:hypothetical protein
MNSEHPDRLLFKGGISSQVSRLFTYVPDDRFRLQAKRLYEGDAASW